MPGLYIAPYLFGRWQARSEEVLGYVMQLSAAVLGYDQCMALFKASTNQSVLVDWVFVSHIF